MKKQPWKYTLVFLITLAIFTSAWYTSDTINKRKFANLQASQNQISIDILSSETQFDLLKDDTCDASATSVFSDDLATLAEKIAYSEQNVGTPDEISALKKQYTLLEVRDFLLTKRVAERCHQNPVSIFYFYGTKEGCGDCANQGYVLDALRQSHPEVRVYAFDYHLDLSTIKALRTIYKIGDTLPTLVVNGVTYNGFQSLDELNALIPKQVVRASKSVAK
jgi:hypothetical protein